MKSGSRLEKILTSGTFAVTGELGPPKNSDPEVVRKKARILKGHVDAVNITDCQTAIVRMSSIAAGLITLQEGVEPVIQMTCRDRNRIGMQSDILGAAALGLKNLLCLTGDHQKFGNHPGSKGVFDMDSIQLLGMVRAMRDEKKFQCGEEMKSAEPRLFLGCAANPFANPFEFRAPRLGKKVANGADFVQTQIIYNVEKFTRFMEMVCDLGIHEKAYILAGVTPPKSLGMARYMKNFVPGMDVPDDIISRMKDAKDKQEEGINICVDIINRVKEIKGVAGVHIMAIEWEEAVPEIVKRAKLATRPAFEEDAAVTQKPVEAPIEITTAPAEAVTSVDHEKLLAEARSEAEKIIAQARQEVEKMRAAAAVSVPGGVATEYEDAGEHEMNERERQMALQSVQMGLNALRKAFNLTDDQFEALSSFASAEAVLKRQPQEGGAAPAPAAAPEVKKATEPKVDAAAEKAAAEAKAAEEARKAAEAKAAEEARKAAEVKAAEEARKAAEAKAAEEARKAAEAKAAEEAKKAAPAKPAPTAVAASAELAVAELAVEKTSLAERSAKVPAASYKINYTGTIKETVLGSGDKALKVGGEASLPFYLFEGGMPNKPVIAMDVLDVKPDEWPDSLARHYQGVLGNPLDWARKCINEYHAEAICLSLVSTDPNGMNRSAAEAAKAASEVINNIDVPVIVWGCGNADKDTETLREITSLTGDKKVCLAPLSDANYRSLGATAMAFQNPLVAASPIDVNLAKQLNILLQNLGVPLSSVMMDPSVGALGYGIEYTYSVMERIRLAALTQQDEKLQVPIICNLGREVWKAKECRLPSDDMIGDMERRGIMMEAITATCMLLSGGEVLIMRHPKAVNLTKSLINSLTSGK
ncbi:MAG: methylenetetrahydrofolate reductase [Desulfobulbaceae bacterium DB1]|nr:MAG: methylenetetrahydrofolate reductase [Desulfobulbaceae bacterium DB1]